MKKTFSNLLTIIILLLPVAIIAQPRVSVPEPERTRNYDVQHIKMNVAFDWPERKVMGEVETRISPLSENLTEFEVDAVDFSISNVRDEKNADVRYEYNGKKLKIFPGITLKPGESFTYTVNYTCVPQRGLFFIYPTELNPSLPYQIWTQGEAEDHRYWLPLYDYPNDKTTWEIYVTVDAKYKTLSNGVLELSRKIHDTGERMDHWVMDKPNSTYLIMLAVGDFNVIEATGDGIPVQSYTGKDVDPRDAEYTFRNVPAMMKVLNEKFNYIYPWNKYAQITVEDFTYGGMENTTATVLTKRIIYNHENEPDYTGDGTISHELGHQWWGDLTTCRNWSEMWLNESFATYSESLWLESLSRDDYDYDIYTNELAAIRSENVLGRYPVWSGYGKVTANEYQKGSVAVHSFRHVLGEDFFPALGYFLKKHEYKNVETQDMVNAFNEYYNTKHDDNKDFKWMFDQWIWKAGYPELNVKYDHDENDRKLTLYVKQVQKIDTLTPVFRLPVNVRIKNSTTDRIEKLEVMDEDETFVIDIDAAPDMIVFDHGNNFMDKIYFEKPFTDWKNQYEFSEFAVDRIMALNGLENFLKEDTTSIAGKPPITINQVEALKVFENALNNDPYYGVKIMAARILGKNFVLDRTSDVLKNAYANQSSPRVKREILRSLGNSQRTEDCGFIQAMITDEKNNYIVADGIYALAKCMDRTLMYDFISKFNERPSHRGYLQFAVVDALDSADNSVNDPRIKELIKNSAFGTDVESRVRTNAIGSLRQYAADEDIKALAMKHAEQSAIFVKRALISLLGNSKDKNVADYLRRLKDKTTDESMKTLISSSIKKIEG